MKYKVGDRVRLKDGHLLYLGEQYFHESFLVKNHIRKNYITSSEISHLVISEITDELINRFKKEKIAWHFKSEEDYGKALDILYNKELKFYFKRWEFEYDCINYDEHSLYRENFENYKSDGYEIIEIMKPVYVPFTDFTEEIEVNGIYKYDNCLKGNVKGKPMYKGIDCEVMYQHYINIQSLGKKNIDLWNEIQRLTKENDDLKQMIKNQQFVIQSHREKLGTIRDVLDED